MQNGHTGVDVHYTKSIAVTARDIGSFWTVQVVVRDENENVLTVDYYVPEFDPETMERHASALEAGAKSIRELAKKRAKQAGCEDCDGTGKVDCTECKED